MKRVLLAAIFTVGFVALAVAQIGITMFPGPGGIARTPKVVTFRNTATASNTNTVTLTSEPIGAAQSDRYVVAAVGGAGSGNSVITSITICGSSPSSVTGVSNATSDAEMYILNVPTGTTCTVSVTFGGSKGGIVLSLYTITGLSSVTIVGAGNSTVNNTATAITTVSGGVAIGLAVANAAGTFTWTNLTEDFDTQINTKTVSGASVNNISGTSLSITANGTSTSSPAQIFVSW